MTELRTARLLLRRARPDDLDAFHAVLSDPEATRYWSTLPHPDLETTRVWLDAMIASPPALREDFVVEWDGRVIGKTGCYRLPEIGFILHRDAWGRGLAREALEAVSGYIFATRPEIDALMADVDPQNQRSLRLLKSVGFEVTGSAQRTWLVGNEWKDSLYLTLRRP
ncbi:MAG: GNAT family N-acetyltransferase [Caulobacteraceae bacterium]|nr:GNAT family N-acetyltransferase [Caulobacteraceae bacterium]